MKINFQNIRHVIFDLDGTVINTELTVLKIVNQMRIEFGLRALSLIDISQYLSWGGRELMARCFLDVNVNLDILIDKFRSIYLMDKLDKDCLCPGVLSFMGYLRSKSIDVSLCTNKPKLLVKKVLVHHAIDDFFNKIVDGDDVVEKKPNPEGINLIINSFRYEKSQIIMIGDSIVDKEAAYLAGIKYFHYCEDETSFDGSGAIFRFDSYQKLRKMWE